LEIASSHNVFAQQLRNEIEEPLRSYTDRKAPDSETGTIGGNLNKMAIDMKDAQEKLEKLKKKGSKSNPTKLDVAIKKLEQESSQVWLSSSWSPLGAHR
jgi:hypothetical protein